MELRCQAKLHGILRDGDVLEVKCGSSFCGAAPGVVVLHRFNLHTGGVETVKYKDPGSERSQQHGTGDQRPALRSA